jgi:hypothetical protein
MALAFYIFPAAVAASLIGFVIWAFRFGQSDFRTQASLVTLVCLFMSFALGFGLVCYDPHFIDNGSEEFIEWRFRWSWATMFAGVWQFAIVPIGLAVYGYWYYRKSKAAAV